MASLYGEKLKTLTGMRNGEYTNTRINQYTNNE